MLIACDITPSEGSMYIIIGSGVNVNVVNGTGTFFIQNQAVDNLYIYIYITWRY
jgi:hypothetical protein